MTNSSLKRNNKLGWVGLRGKFLRRREGEKKRIERKLEVDENAKREPRGAWFLFGRCLLPLLLFLLAVAKPQEGPKVSRDNDRRLKYAPRQFADQNYY